MVVWPLWAPCWWRSLSRRSCTALMAPHVDGHGRLCVCSAGSVVGAGGAVQQPRVGTWRAARRGDIHQHMVAVGQLGKELGLLASGGRARRQGAGHIGAATVEFSGQCVWLRSHIRQPSSEGAVGSPMMRAPVVSMGVQRGACQGCDRGSLAPSQPQDARSHRPWSKRCRGLGQGCQAKA
jgi:hypothetical protein